MFFKKDKFSQSGPFDYMIVGLGNPGKKYEFTKHNAGFLCVDLLAQQLGVKIDRLKFKSLMGDVRINSKRCLLLKPQTFMNLSGEAVREAAQFYNLPPERIIVIFDDISLEPGRLRIRRKGSDGGHNGIKSIIYQLQSDAFPRIKLGIGAKPNPDFDLAAWVLEPFTKEALKALRTAADNACAAVGMMVDGKIDEAMSRYNS